VYSSIVLNVMGSLISSDPRIPGEIKKKDQASGPGITKKIVMLWSSRGEWRVLRCSVGGELLEN
ncbi:MAG: hypothetical protein ACRDJK_07725, partial [Actinomycetota bacterium]